MTSFTLNGEAVDFSGSEHKRLVPVLHDDHEMTGTRGSCGIGMCGTCTVLVDGKAMSACLLLIGQLEGKTVQTIEGLSENGVLHPVQKAYIDEFAFQCAYCTPGFIMAAESLLSHNSTPDEQAIREAISGNLCRCTGYNMIVRGIARASRIGEGLWEKHTGR